MCGNEIMNVLIVDDIPENLLVLEALLEDLNCNIIKATSGNEALGVMLEQDIALILLDVQMPDMDGFETAELMRMSEKTKYIPIIFITAISKEQKCIFKGYEVGAVDYLFKPIEPVILRSKVSVFIDLHNQKTLLKKQTELLELKIKEITELKVENNKLENLSTVDGLTGIPNRRSFDNFIKMNWENSLIEAVPISIVMMDIDYFKAYNDNYGHLQGDDCLVQVAKGLASSARQRDLVARYGGEEFIAVLPHTDSDEALLIAERMRKKVEELSIPHEYSGVSSYITISLGVQTIIPTKLDSLEEFINSADKALYEAKSKGRNRVETLDIIKVKI